MSTMTKETALAMIEELDALPFLYSDNRASHFSRSISWHPRWYIIFDIIASVKDEYEELLPLREEIQKAIIDGKTYHFDDWGEGWEWRVRAVKVNGLAIHLMGNGACVYKGQHDRPVITL